MNKFLYKYKKMFVSFWISCNEKTYYTKETRLKYLFFNRRIKSDILLVIFSAYSKNGALYNYVRSLSEFKNIPRLYIKDDFGPDKTGSYYLGEKGKHNVEGAVVELIDNIRNKVGGDGNIKIIFIGSSKGGYAALNFAVMFNHSVAIVGSPQYHLGDHLNEEYFFPMLEDIIGERTTEKIENLNNHIRNKYLKWNKSFEQYIFLQYSKLEWSNVFNEYTYEKHIKFLINDILELTNIKTSFEVLDYKDHNDVHKYFPPYLKKCLRIIIKNRTKLDDLFI